MAKIGFTRACLLTTVATMIPTMLSSGAALAQSAPGATTSTAAPASTGTTAAPTTSTGTAAAPTTSTGTAAAPTTSTGTAAAPTTSTGTAAAPTTSTGTATSANGSGPVDPGPRGGAAGAGGPLPGLSQAELSFFNASAAVFQEVDGVPNGLGPRFNMDSCAGCHAQPAAGGSSPPTNPQVAAATKAGAQNTLPSYITANGPVREARFVTNPDGTPDGSVHDVFVITGRSDAPGCNITQPDFAGALAANNVIFRIPTPTFGLGLVEAVPDSGLEAAIAANAQQGASLGIAAKFNRAGPPGTASSSTATAPAGTPSQITGAFNDSNNDQTITRFGWKAQNKSLLIFAGEAYNVEQGVTNDAFPNERESDPNCQFNPTPESTTNLTIKTNNGQGTSQAAGYSQDIVDFAAFMRLSAPPTPASSTTPAASSSTTPTSSTTASSTTPTSSTTASSTAPASSSTTPAASSSTTPATSSSTTPATSSATSTTSVLASAAGTSSSSSTGSSATTASVSQGQQDFVNVGCAACHIPNQTTGKSAMTGQSNVTFHPYSDFALHDMGTGLADGVSQGNASGDQFRTAPLWGVGQRVFFLHDGRTNDLVQAIQQHSSNGSEANAVIQNFNMLGQNDQQAIINFLRSL